MDSIHELRNKALKKMESGDVSDGEVSQLSMEEIKVLVHELQVHQTELAIQNEELRETANELEYSYGRYSELYQFAPVGYLTLCEKGLIRQINFAGAQLLSKEKQSLINVPFSSFVHPDDLSIFFPHVREVFRTGASQNCEIRIIVDNAQLYVRLQSVAMESIEGQQSCLTVISDISDQKKSEEAIRKSEERFRAISEITQDLIFMLDTSLKITYVNPAVEKLYGIPASKMIWRTFEELVGPEKSQRDNELDRRVLKGETIEDEYGLHINGVDMVFLDTRMPLTNSSGDITGILCISRDITDRKRREFPVGEDDADYPSKITQATLKMARMAAPTQSTVLLLGESGSGKDHLAKFIHSHSERAGGPYFAVNCAAISRELAESELFGHEKGAFTGAHGRKRGLLELAESGTILLNEIGELSLAIQSKLLTFLDTKKFTRVGGEKEISVNARLIAATNRNLEEEVESGRFRKDLYYRLNVISIVVPPLRERREDIPILVKEFLVGLHSDLQLKEAPTIDASAMNVLINYDWPGNVRELRNVLERALMLSKDNKIHLHGLDLSVPEDHFRSHWHFVTEFPEGRSLNEVSRDLKQSLINEALRRSGGSRQGAAKLLGISRYSLKHYMKSLDLADDEQD